MTNGATQPGAGADDTPGTGDGFDLVNVESWTETPSVQERRERASLEIARTIIYIFAGVLVFYGVAASLLMVSDEAKFSESFEMLKFMINAVLPLVTLAVGYYLGDRTAPPTSNDSS